MAGEYTFSRNIWRPCFNCGWLFLAGREHPCQFWAQDFPFEPIDHLNQDIQANSDLLPVIKS